MKKQVKWLFQGDSITDAGRDKRNYRHMGYGYPKYASSQLSEENADIDFDFYNLGISGNRSCQLFDRLYHDAIAFQPDVISILIGINDIWHRYGAEKIATTDAQFELNYRTILTQIKESTNAKIVILSPYLLDAEDKQAWRDDLERVLLIVRRLADEFADVYIPLDELFDEAMKTQPSPLFYSGDGVHPNDEGARFIGKHYAEAVTLLLQSL